MKKKYKRLILALLFLCLNTGMLTMVTNAAESTDGKLKTPVITLSNVQSTGKIKIEWTSVEGAVSYKVYRSHDGETWSLLKNTTKTSLVNTSAKAGEKYYYRVKAIASESSLNSAYSKVKYRTCDLKRPTITLANVKSTGKIKVSWEKVDGAVSYKVYNSQDKKSWKLIKTTSSTSVTNTSVVAGKKYYYKVRAIASDSAANSAYSVIKYRTCRYPNEKISKKYVLKPTVRLYKSPSSSSSYITILYMTEVEIGKAVTSGNAGRWYNVYYQNQLYYVWLTSDSGKFTTEKSSFTYEGNTKYQQEVIDLAVDICLNWDTVYAHNQSDGVKNADGTYGFDCSGFASYVLNTVMQKKIPTYRLTSNISKLCSLDAIYNEGYTGEFSAKTIAKKNLQPGDIIFFSQKSKNDHCGIYLGNGEFVHSTKSVNGVSIMPLSDSYLEDLSVIRRYLPKTVSAANAVEEIKSGCKMYSKRNDDSSVLCTLKKGTKVTVLYTGNSDPSYNMAYVKKSDGTKGFVYTKNFK